MSGSSLPKTFGELRRNPDFSERRLAGRSVRDEIRENLTAKLRSGEPLFPGIVGFEDTVIPYIVNALLSKQNFILLGLRGQAKSRILRKLIEFLDPALPYIAGVELHDNPYAPISKPGRDTVAAMGDDTPIAYLTPDQRYVEKLATPDVTIADMIGDIDPIKAARRGIELGDESTMHFGLLPRAHRGIFAINELPDLMSKIQVGLFNIMQEGDVQIKGYPVRLSIDVLLVFSANPEDYTARGKIITPLKDRIGSEIRTHYPLDVGQAMEITRREAWADRGGSTQTFIPDFIRETVEQIAFAARKDSKIDKRSGVSQRLSISCLENVVSNAERRALAAGKSLVVPRVGDVYAAMPSVTGRFELEYEGELKGAEHVARELIRTAVGRVFDRYFSRSGTKNIVDWFEMGGNLRIGADESAGTVVEQLDRIQGLPALAAALIPNGRNENEIRAAAGEFILDGLYAHRRISRNEEVGYTRKPHAGQEKRREAPGDFGAPDIDTTYN